MASLPVAEIKIDGRFVRDLPAGGANLGITRAIIGLAHHLDHSVTAEGVEDEQAMAVFATLGCDAVQGYHVSRPQPAPQFVEWLATSPWGATPGSS